MTPYRPDIDGLRAIAVLSVVLFHAGVPGMTGGYTGVDVFFVISGYLITRIVRDDLAAGRFSLVAFYERRARRILPALLVVIAASLLAAAILLLPYQFKDLSKEALAATFFYSNIRFFHTSDYFSPDSEFSILLHTWSLAVEEQFYIVFPLLLWLVYRIAPRAAVPVVAALAVASLVLAEVWLRETPAASFYLAPARAWELGIGSLLALLPAARLGRPVREALAAAGLAAIAVPVALYDATTPFPGLMALAPCLGAAAVIATGASGTALVHRLLALRPIVFVGLVSYSLYLWHWPVLALLRNVKGDVILTPGETAAALALAAAGAVASWAFVERPFRRRGQAEFSRKAIFTSSAAGMASVALVSGGIWMVDRHPQMFGTPARLAAEGIKDRNPDHARCFRRRPADGLCRFGASAAPAAPADFILWGDSHADAMMPGIAEAARSAGRTGMFAGLEACVPLLGIDRLVAGSPAVACARFNTAVMAEIEKREEIRTVVLAGRWALWSEGSFAAGERGGAPFVLYRVGADGPYPRTPDGNARLFEAALQETVARLRAAGRTVVILGGTPEPGWNVSKRLVAHLQWGQPLPEPPTLAQVRERNRRVDAALAAVAAPPAVRVVDLARALCAPACALWQEGRPLFYDDDHMSAYGARAIVAPLVTSLFASEPEDRSAMRPRGP